MTNEEYNAFLKAWDESQTWEQGGEGPSAKNRGDFKAGFFAALNWKKSIQEETKENICDCSYCLSKKK